MVLHRHIYRPLIGMQASVCGELSQEPRPKVGGKVTRSVNIRLNLAALGKLNLAREVAEGTSVSAK